jgi:hypothetical protein
MQTHNAACGRGAQRRPCWGARSGCPGELLPRPHAPARSAGRTAEARGLACSRARHRGRLARRRAVSSKHEWQQQELASVARTTDVEEESELHRCGGDRRGAVAPRASATSFGRSGAPARPPGGRWRPKGLPWRVSWRQGAARRAGGRASRAATAAVCVRASPPVRRPPPRTRPPPPPACTSPAAASPNPSCPTPPAAPSPRVPPSAPPGS